MLLLLVNSAVAVVPVHMGLVLDLEADLEPWRLVEFGVLTCLHELLFAVLSLVLDHNLFHAILLRLVEVSQPVLILTRFFLAYLEVQTIGIVRDLGLIFELSVLGTSAYSTLVGVANFRLIGDP